MTAKLTLKLDADLIERAKHFSRRQNKSISQIVADYFAALDEEAHGQPAAEQTLLVASLRGAIKDAVVTADDHREHLAAKHLGR